jgi:hypothetical protein
MNATTYTIESVHGIKQTVVLVPAGQKANGKASKAEPAASEPQRDQQDRMRSSK